MKLQQKFEFVWASLEWWLTTCVFSLGQRRWTIRSKAGGFQLAAALFVDDVIGDFERRRLELYVEHSELLNVFGDDTAKDAGRDATAIYLYPTASPAIHRRGGSRVSEALGVKEALSHRLLFWFWHCALNSQTVVWRSGTDYSVLDRRSQTALRFLGRFRPVSDAVRLAEDIIVHSVATLAPKERQDLELSLFLAVNRLERADQDDLLALMEREECGDLLTDTESRTRVALMKLGLEKLPIARRDLFLWKVRRAISRSTEALASRAVLRSLPQKFPPIEIYDSLTVADPGPVSLSARGHSEVNLNGEYQARVNAEPDGIEAHNPGPAYESRARLLEDIRAFQSRAEYLLAGERLEDVEDLCRAVRASPRLEMFPEMRARVMTTQADVLGRLGRHDEAMAISIEAARVFGTPTASPVLCARANLQAASAAVTLGLESEARDCVSEAIRLCPDSRSATGIRARLLLMYLEGRRADFAPIVMLELCDLLRDAAGNPSVADAVEQCAYQMASLATTVGRDGIDGSEPISMAIEAVTAVLGAASPWLAVLRSGRDVQKSDASTSRESAFLAAAQHERSGQAENAVVLLKRHLYRYPDAATATKLADLLLRLDRLDEALWANAFAIDHWAQNEDPEALVGLLTERASALREAGFRVAAAVVERAITELCQPGVGEEANG